NRVTTDTCYRCRAPRPIASDPFETIEEPTPIEVVSARDGSLPGVAAPALAAVAATVTPKRRSRRASVPVMLEAAPPAPMAVAADPAEVAALAAVAAMVTPKRRSRRAP